MIVLKLFERRIVSSVAFVFCIAAIFPFVAKAGESSLSDAVVNLVNSGVELAKKGKNKEAIAEFEKAEKLQPKDELVLFNLGQAYQMSGRNADALKCYKNYLGAYPKGKYVPLIANMIRVMQTQITMSRGTSSAGLDNYLSEATAIGACHWFDDQLPVKVFIADGKGVDGFKPEYGSFLKEAFEKWTKAVD